MAARSRSLGRLAALVAAAVALASLSSEALAANSRLCRQLEAELASAGRGGSTAQLRKQDASILKQREQLELAKRQARRSGCGFRLFGGSDSCRSINLKVEKMERNLDALQRRRSRAADAGSGRSRSQVVAALRANGCRDEAVAERRPPRGSDGTRGLLDRIFGGGIPTRGSIDELGEPRVRRDENVVRVPEGVQGGWVNDRGRIRYSAPPGTYRTLCVRSCDGYYFPMSSASSPSDFARDQANCQSSCPGTEVQIYYHRPGQESDSMRSGLSGRPYADLPTAWLYKQTGTPTPAGCSCGAARNDGPKNFSVIAGNPPPPVVSEPVLPSPRPDPAADPETLANRDGGPNADALRRLAVAPRINKPAAPGEDRKVRVVGPAFLPDPEAAADLQAPDPIPVR
ncbi:MAG TPA: DUF2865 domain-containing protein [Rhizobiaceae bacterium]